MKSNNEGLIAFKRYVGLGLMVTSLYPLVVFVRIPEKLTNIVPSTEYLATTVLMGFFGLMLFKGEVDKSPKIILGKAFVIGLLIVGLNSLVSK